MANHQTNFTSNFGEMGETGNAALVLNVNGTSHTYHPVGSDVSVDVATVRRILATAPNLAQSIASVLAAGGYPILVYDGSEYGYIKTVNSRYVFTCLDSLNGVKQAEVDIQDGTITAGTSGVDGVSILARTDSDLFAKITTAITLGRMPIISDTGVYYQLIAKTGTIAQFGRIADTGALEVLTVNNSDQITSSSFVFVQDPYYVHTDNNFTNTYKSNVDANTNARHTHTNKSVLDDIEQSNIDNWDNKLNPTGDASDTTSTFTKASGDTSTITSGGKLSVIFTAISSFFASLKALAFKDKASYSDLSSSVQSSLNKADSALQSHQSVTDNNPTLAWDTTSTVGTVGSTGLRVTMPSDPASGKADKASITGATKCKITYNSQGIVTAGADLSASDIPDLAASKITSGQFGTDRIADDAITAAKVKDNETLPVNISGMAIPSRISPLKGWVRLAYFDFSSAGNNLYYGRGVTFELFGSGYLQGQSYLGKFQLDLINYGDFSSRLPNTRTLAFVDRVVSVGVYNQFKLKLVCYSNHVEVYMYHDRDGDYPIGVKVISSIESYNSGISYTLLDFAFIADADWDTFIADKTSEDAVWANVTASNAMYASRIGRYDSHPQIGSTSTPVYVDSNGQVQSCTPSSMSVGKAVTASKSVFYTTDNIANYTRYLKIGNIETSEGGQRDCTFLVTAPDGIGDNIPTTYIVSASNRLGGHIVRYARITPEKGINQNLASFGYVVKANNSIDIMMYRPAYSGAIDITMIREGDLVADFDNNADGTGYVAGVRYETVMVTQQVGSTSIPVYVDSNGQVQPCGFSVNFGTPVSGAKVLNIVTA